VQVHAPIRHGELHVAVRAQARECLVRRLVRVDEPRIVTRVRVARAFIRVASAEAVEADSPPLVAWVDSTED
jgi:hypothetical protein